MASASENVEVQSSPKKIIEKTVSDAAVEQNGKQDELITNGQANKSPKTSPQKNHSEIIEDGSKLEDARSPQEAELVEDEQVATAPEDEPETTAASGDVEKNGEATEVVEEAAAAESQDVAAPKTSPTKSVSPLKKKAEAGDATDEPDVKKARHSLAQNGEADATNDTVVDVIEAANGAAVEATE